MLSRSLSARGNDAQGILPGESFTLKTEVDLQLITEIWVEPLAVVDELEAKKARKIWEEVRITFAIKLT